MTHGPSFEQYGSYVFIGGHTPACNDRQEKLGEEFGQDSNKCACKFFRNFLKEKYQRKQKAKTK